MGRDEQGKGTEEERGKERETESLAGGKEVRGEKGRAGFSPSWDGISPSNPWRRDKGHAGFSPRWNGLSHSTPQSCTAYPHLFGPPYVAGAPASMAAPNRVNWILLVTRIRLHEGGRHRVGGQQPSRAKCKLDPVGHMHPPTWEGGDYACSLDNIAAPNRAN